MRLLLSAHPRCQAFSDAGRTAIAQLAGPLGRRFDPLDARSRAIDALRL